MSRFHSRLKHPHGFTLIELVIAVAVIAILVTLTFKYTQRSLDKARQIKCAGQMRQIYAGIMNYVSDNNGRFYSLEEIGNSSYRAADDKLGLPDILDRGDYLKKGPQWLSPAGRPELAQYGNSYAWNRNANLCGKPLGAIDDLGSVAMLWNNYSFTLPSVHRVPEGPKGGPRTAPNAYWHYSFEDRTAVNFLYADGHVELKVLKVPKKQSGSGTGTGTDGSGSTSGGSQSGSGSSSGEGSGGGGLDTSGPIDAKPKNRL